MRQQQWMMNEDDETTSEVIEDTEEITIIEKINQEFYEKYDKSKKGKKRFRRLIKSVKIQSSFSVEDSSNEYSLKLTGKTEEINKIMPIIRQTLKTFVNNYRFTHLITIPFIDETFMQSYLDFKQRIQNDHPNINESLFQNSKKLHMTIALLSLNDEQRLKRALELFKQDCSEFTQKNMDKFSENSIQIKGIDIMNENAEKTRVLYAKLHRQNHEDYENIQNIVNFIASTMASNDLWYNGDKFLNRSELEKQNIKLHLTLMNTSFLLKKPSKKRIKKSQKYTHFDSTEILSKYKDHDFGRIVSPKIQLNELHRMDDFGYYKCLESIPLMK